MNEIANFCEKVGANVDMVRIGIGSDSRIGKRFLFPGVGYGGSCFPKDVQALSKSGKENNYPFQILEAVMAVNENQKTILLPKIKKYFEENLAGKKIALWGLAFKPDTDDIREAPSLYIINGLLEAGATVSAFDPEAMQNVQNILSNQIEFAPTHYDALKNADALIIVTEWPLFRTPDFDKMKLLMKNPVIFDGRNIYDLDTMKENGFYYSSIGRKTIEK